MTIDQQWFAKCDTCEKRFANDTEYFSRLDLVHDLNVAGWENNDDDTHTCRACVRRATEDLPYMGPPIHDKPTGFVDRALSWD